MITPLAVWTSYITIIAEAIECGVEVKALSNAGIQTETHPLALVDTIKRISARKYHRFQYGRSMEQEGVSGYTEVRAQKLGLQKMVIDLVYTRCRRSVTQA